ncbi:MAG: hypothetical protein HYV63_33945 [Candidatus Schekmanbacteria bacterium]|nr:hypothetical protein [Candidatus Schekmanbacteria bacterium]
MDALRQFLNQDVEVSANRTVYAGTLTGIGESELYLRASGRWMAIPLSAVKSIRPRASYTQMPFTDDIFAGLEEEEKEPKE